MALLPHLFLHSFLLGLGIRVSLTFNIDLTNPNVYDGERDHFFGYKVLQFTSGESKGIFVSAPLNGSGAICKLGRSRASECFTRQEILFKNQTFPVRNLGLSIIKGSDPSTFTACSPSLAHGCNDNSYLNSVCFPLPAQGQQPRALTPAFQDCTKKQVDLVFLFDGSLSMTEAEFQENKKFIKNIMVSLKNTSFKFAAVQFSNWSSKVFDFNEYEDGSAEKALDKEPHMKSLTNTHKALQFVLVKLFENKTAGVSPDSTKVLVLITDGDPSDPDNDIISQYDEKNIIRFVIGVKQADITKFRAIASEPKDKNAFKIEKYGNLTGILENFQKRIFKMEGTRTSQAGDLKNEMAQTGFSGVSHNDTLILGSVGSYSWKGSLHELRGQKTTQIDDPDMQMDSYLGYAVSVGERNNAVVYFAGAPRSEHVGQVVLFKNDGMNWTVAQKIRGNQIGSYFGAELCSLDVDSDGNTDFLLVGAPLFYQPQEKREGQIHVYRLTKEMKLQSEQNVNALSMGRFGTSITSVADLNGDGLRDVAVGAPLEDDNRGVVYIYLGDGQKGIRSTFSQRIQNIQPKWRFFGQAIDGGIDLGADGLPDIVIGSQGAVVVLRSKPVFNVSARLYFEPKTISIENIDCVSATDKTFQMGELVACFHMAEATKSVAGSLKSGLNISCFINVDPLRQMSRGFFNETGSKARNHTATHELLDKENCFSYRIYMTECVRDTLSPIGINFTFSQVNGESSQAVLNVDSRRQLHIEVPFEKQCRKNDSCVAELDVDFTFMTQTLLVAEDSYFNLSLKLANSGDDSYNTSLTIFYPLGLSFSRMTQQTRSTQHICLDQEGVIDRTTCSISLPVYRSRSVAAFNASFRIMTDEKWNDTVSLTVAGASDNANPNRSSSVTKSIPVQFQIKMAITVKEDSVSYLNFSTDDTAPKRINMIFKLDNPGWKAFPVNVSFTFPLKLENNFEMENYQVFVQQNKTECTNRADMKTGQRCPDNSCGLLVCESFILDKESATEFRLSGDVHFRDLRQQAGNLNFLTRFTGNFTEVKFRSFIHVKYDTHRYVLDSSSQKAVSQQAEVRVELMVPPDQVVIIVTGASLGLLLLIIITVVMWKLGFFKRKNLYEDQSSPAGGQGGTEEKEEAPSEEKVLVSADTKLPSSEPIASEKNADS
ncbi:integrin alpha-D isoform X1 [Takifugu flavidus]|uniref:integrin alpha-D isoform X1 n=1 Tax=Takifugu flavidus TaxID=433684 RepID=UPI0025446FB9|nr:integrin alpha-D isoform X1 [Takifugu flavidus]